MLGSEDKEADMPYNILLIDDDKDFRDEFRDYLEDYKVIEAASGAEALNLLRKPNEIDLVILDVMIAGVERNRGLEADEENSFRPGYYYFNRI